MPIEPAATLRIAMVLPRLDLGGMERTVLAQARALRAAGHHAVVVVLAPGGALSATADHWDIPLHAPPQALRLAAATAFIAAAATRERATHVHSHTGTWLASARAARVVRVPHVHTRHGFLERPSWRSTVSDMLAARATTRVVCVSTELLADTQRRLRVPAPRCVLIPNGVACDALPVLAPRAVDAPPVCAMVCRLTVVKNVALALEALARARAVVPSMTLQVVGDGPERASLMARTRALGIADAVVWHGASDAPWTQVPAGAIVVQSSDSEGLSLSLIEAMALGCRVVATDVGQTRAFTDGARGVWCVPPGDPAALAHTLVTVAHQAPAEAQAAGASNRAHARAHGSLETVVSALEALYAAVRP